MQISAQNIPVIGHPGTIDIANWNVEWLGKTDAGFGPSNDSLQEALVDSVLLKSMIDIWILSEVSDTMVFRKMLSKQQRYLYLIAPTSPEQKNVILYDSSIFKSGPYQVLGLTQPDSFSTGRFPLQLALIPKKAQNPDTLFIIALHLKSNTGNDTQKMAAYNSRKRSSEWLAAYLKGKGNLKRILVAGDWNDDLDFSIYNNLPSPLINCKNLYPEFIYLTQSLSDNDISTTAGFNNPIDHQLASKSLSYLCNKDSSFVWRLDHYMTKYSQTCSDHFPVISRFSTNLSNINSLNYSDLSAFPNPVSDYLYLNSPFPIISCKLINSLGQIFNLAPDNKRIDLKHFKNGFYILKIESESGPKLLKIAVYHE